MEDLLKRKRGKKEGKNKMATLQELQKQVAELKKLNAEKERQLKIKQENMREMKQLGKEKKKLEKELKALSRPGRTRFKKDFKKGLKLGFSKLTKALENWDTEPRRHHPQRKQIRRSHKRKPTNSMFNHKVKNPRLANKINITSPTAFRKSIRDLKKNGLNATERKALTLAKNRATAQLNRKNLSPKERKQFQEISKTKIPKRKVKK